MIDYLKHIFRSLKTFEISIFVLFFHFFKREKKIDASEYIQKGDFSSKNFKSWLKIESDVSIEEIKVQLEWNSSQWLKHNFDLLGTGWCSRNIGAIPVGFLGYTNPETNNNRPVQKSILSERASALVDDNYIYLDWQRDIKSGYLWDINLDSNSQSNFLSFPYSVDVKIPWELARLNHLPLLLLSAQHDLVNQEACLKEYKNIVCDFIANNPYKKGVNWSNAMEVSIRAVNILAAYDISMGIDDSNKILESNFQAILFDSLFEHTRFILENSEFKKGYTNNHYYANISALLFIGNYFSKSKSGKNLLNIAAREIFVETNKQFLPDGGNFESSTHYHRLSTEMLIWNCIILSDKNTSALIDEDFELKWNNNYKVSENYEIEKDQLQFKAIKALEFSHAITKGNGNIAGCGDQDSGRFLKFNLEGKWQSFNDLKKYDHQIHLGNYQWNESEQLWVENDLSQNCIQVLGKALSKLEVGTIENYPFEAVLSNLLIQNEIEKIPILKPKSVKFGDLLYWHTSTIFYPGEIENLKRNLDWYIFPFFGIYIARTKHFFLSINATNNHLKKYWSHGKNDKLSFELRALDKDIIVDPGSFIYTPDEKLRNKFRSTSSHSTISVKNKEQNRWPKGKRSIFNLYNESRCKFLSQTDNRISILCEYRGIKHVRTFIIHNDHLEIVDECTHEFSTHFNYLNLYSEHYGRWRKAKKES
ncbi:alginate lyase family protein [Hyphobacterium sp. CCMP332]|nr:alginate lyase family protein [Hyphobacterium sp. CCMP332]